MMNIKKIISALLLFAVLLSSLSLFSCHTRKPEEWTFTMPEEFDTSKTYEITFWAKNENNAAQRQIYKEAVEGFQEIYPNIKVTLRNFTDYNEIYQNVITNISTNTTPNVCITYPDHIATYLGGDNVVFPIGSIIDDENYGLGGKKVAFDSPSSDEIVPQFLEEGKIDGELYALPFMRSTEACYVNVDLLRQLGYELPEVLTWEFVWEVSEYAMSLGKDENGNYVANGQKTLIPTIYKSTDNMMISMLKQLDAPYSTDDGDILIFNDKTKDILYDIATHTESGAFSTFKISSYPGNFLNAGQCIFAIDSTAGATWMGCEAPLIDIPEDELRSFETVVMPIPQFNADEPKMISQGPSLCIFNKKDSGEVLASWLFAQYLLTNETQIAYSQTEGYIPVTNTALNSEEYKDYLSRKGEDNDLYYDVKISASELMINNIENSFTTPVFNGSMSLRNAAGELVELTASSVNRNRVIDEAFMDLVKTRVTALYKLDQLGEGEENAKKEFGELPAESVILLSTLGCAWLGIGAYFVISKIRKRNS